MTEVNSIEFLLPHNIFDQINKLGTGENVAWKSSAVAHSAEFLQSQIAGEGKESSFRSSDCNVASGTEINISATKFRSGTLHLLFDKLTLNVIAGRLGCAISEVEERSSSGVQDSSGSQQEEDITYSGFHVNTCSEDGDQPVIENYMIADGNEVASETVITQDSMSVSACQAHACGENTPVTGKSLHQPGPDGEGPVIVKRKRGRPRKVKPPECDPVPTKVVSTSVEIQPDTPGRRYSLRGVKLRKELLDAERNGSDEETDLSDVKESLHEEVEAGEGTQSSVSMDIVKTESTTSQFQEMENSKGTQTLKERNSRSSNLPQRGSHRRKRNNVRVAPCEICNKMFCDFTGVEEHVRKSHSSHNRFQAYIEELQALKIVKCSRCDLTFKNRYSLQIHEDMAHCKYAGSSCSVCKKQYKSLRSLRLHERMVHGSKNKEHLCHLCPAKFKWANTLKQHIQEIHDCLENFHCSFCEKRFSRKGQLNRHIRIHGMDSSKRVLCNLCGKGFWYDTNLQRHLSTVHQKHKEKYHCSYCGKGFTQKNSMVSHVRLLHFKLHAYVCKLCNASFPRSKILEDHMKVAHGDEAYKASNLGRQRFKYNRTPDDLFYCTYCSSSFFYKAKMVEHIHKAHANEFPFVCTICSQGFLMRSYLRKHKKAAHDLVDDQAGENSDDDDDEVNKFSFTEDKEQNKSSAHITVLEDTNSQKEMAPASLGMTGNIDMDDLELSDAAAAASVLVEVASGSLTHYVIQNTDQSTDSMAQPEIMGELSADQSNIVQIITSDNGSTQVVLPSGMNGENYELVEGFAEEAILHDGENVTVLSEPVEDTVILTDHNLQFDGNINHDVPLSVVVVESES
ncbi:zinc finger and BTB domain-containing protein 17-like [Liolophura sinensis]|uniref:zinc finger and BTB domain-containing protein 17-like n=1 Tax=Liolophura sinensis TaxID=3198878 RepID=UPI003158CA32